MHTPSVSFFFLALLTTPLVSAHGKVAVVTGDLGGNGTALGIKGAVVAGAGSNSKTELDTTTFNVGSNNCGETEVCYPLHYLSVFAKSIILGWRKKQRRDWCKKRHGSLWQYPSSNQHR